MSDLRERTEPIALVVNPASRGADVVRQAIERWRAVIPGTIETAADAANPERVAELIARTGPAVVVAAGGDGTVSAVAEGILLAGRPNPPALGVLPTGTANNFARSFGLRSLRAPGGGPALDLAMSAIATGTERTIDVGQVGSRHFVSAFAAGLDADILFTRNLLRRQNRLARRFDGYALYLWSCAVNVARDHHGAAMRLCLDGAAREGYAYNLLFTNTPLYAGEFHLGGDDAAGDGLLDLHVFERPLDYLRRLPAAWVRHLRHGRGRAVEPPAEIHRVRHASIELAAPVRCQLDGEEFGRRVTLQVQVVPRALVVRVPRS
jgi:diacylglycerol kinase (ATP)